MPKKIDPAVKERAVRRVLERRAEYASLTAAAAAVAKQERLGAETVRRSALQAKIDVGDRPGTTLAEHAEIKKLKAENAQLREDVAILKAATSFFVGDWTPATDDHRIHHRDENRGPRGRVDLPGAV